jgi:hypothetical protein
MSKYILSGLAGEEGAVQFAGVELEDPQHALFPIHALKAFAGGEIEDAAAQRNGGCAG